MVSAYEYLWPLATNSSIFSKWTEKCILLNVFSDFRFKSNLNLFTFKIRSRDTLELFNAQRSCIWRFFKTFSIIFYTICVWVGLYQLTQLVAWTIFWSLATFMHPWLSFGFYGVRCLLFWGKILWIFGPFHMNQFVTLSISNRKQMHSMALLFILVFDFPSQYFWHCL